MRKFFKYFLIAFSVIAVVGGASLAQMFYRFDVSVYKINRYIQAETNGKKWGTPVDLVPKIFSTGEDFSVVSKILADAGYMETSPQGQMRVFTREANMMVCNISLDVSIVLDDNSKLLKAEGFQQEHGCL